MSDDGDIIASGGATPVTSSPDLITALAAVADALGLAEQRADDAEAASETATEKLFNLQQSWYGFLAGDPALDPNNNSPMNGALYYNTTMDRLMIYDGAAWASLVGIFITGSDAPGVGDGANGDFYVQMPDGTLYGPKAGGEWPAGIAIAGVGPAPWTAPAAWAGSTVYTVGPPASLVVYGGEGYVCTTSHTSTGSFDPSKWIKVTTAAAIPSTSITDSTAAGRALLTAANVAAQLTALGVGTAGLLAAGAVGADLVTAATQAAARSTLGLGSLATASQVPISAAPAGSWVLLATLTAANSASLSDSTSFTSTYDEYEIVLENILPATNSVEAYLQVRSGGAFQTASYKSTVVSLLSGGMYASSLTTGIVLNYAGRLSSAANYGMSGNIRIGGVNNSSYKRVWGQTASSDPAASDESVTSTLSGAWIGGTGVITGVRLQMSSGNIASGKVYIFGRKK